jgi:mRNA-degrading endonuclease HigB of HigAB toxin-antitoxin module
MVGNKRVVFNVKGNGYRRVCEMDYVRNAMWRGQPNKNQMKGKLSAQSTL